MVRRWDMFLGPWNHRSGCNYLWALTINFRYQSACITRRLLRWQMKWPRGPLLTARPDRGQAFKTLLYFCNRLRLHSSFSSILFISLPYSFNYISLYKTLICIYNHNFEINIFYRFTPGSFFLFLLCMFLRWYYIMVLSK